MQITVNENTVSSIEIYEPIKGKPHFVKHSKNRKTEDVIQELNEKLHILLPKQMAALEYEFGKIIHNQLDKENWPDLSTEEIICFYYTGGSEGYYCTIRVGNKCLTHAKTLDEEQSGAEIAGDIAKYACMLLSC